MAALGKFADQAWKSGASGVDDESASRPKLSLADDQASPRPSPARLLQAELQRAFTPGPVAPDRFSKRRALKFIAPTSVAFGLFVALVNHAAHH